MSDQVYKLARSQRIYSGVLVGIGVALITALLLVFAADPRPRATLGYLLIAALAFGPLSIPIGLYHLTAKTELTTSGIRTSHMNSRHECQWQDIVEITTRAEPDSRMSDVTKVIIKLRSGRMFALAAPRQWDPFPADKHFSTKVGIIQAHLDEARRLEPTDS